MQSKSYLGSKTSIWQKLQAISFALVIGFLIFKGIWWYLDYDFKKDKEEILSNPVYTKGVIIAKRTYKGKGADFEYFVDDKKYNLSTGITTEFYKKYAVGDSVDIVYSRKNPSVSLLKYEIDSSK